MSSRRESDEEVRHVSFNQDSSCVAIAHSRGCSVFSLDPLQVKYSLPGEGVGLIQLLHCTSLLALVGSGDQPSFSPRRFRLFNSSREKQETICEISFASSILNVLLNRERVVICLETQIHVYELSSMKCLQILTTAPNPSGLLALSGESSSYLAFPAANAGSGSVVLYDCISLRLLSQIDAHKKELIAMQFNREGTMLATASVTGTVLRLFSVPGGEHLCSFRRGTRAAEITSLSFSERSSVLAAGSSSGTVHLFDLRAGLSKKQQLRGEPAASSSSEEHWRENLTGYALSYLNMAQSWGKAAVGGLHLLPQPMQEFTESMWAIAHARVPTSVAGGKYQVALLTAAPSSSSDSDEDLKLVVVTQNKHLFRFNVPKNISELSSQQLSGEESVVQCSLDDEAVLDHHHED